MSRNKDESSDAFWFVFYILLGMICWAAKPYFHTNTPSTNEPNNRTILVAPDTTEY